MHLRRHCIVVVCLLFTLGAKQASADPELPRTYLDTTFPTLTGKTIMVGAQESFQAALDSAQPGDTIVLQAAIVYQGNFVLPQKSGNGWIVIRSSRLDELQAGHRVSPEDVAKMPILQNPSDSVVSTAPGAHHFRFSGIQIRPTPGSFLTNIVALESGSSAADNIPHDLVFDRVYIHGDSAKGSRRGIALNSNATAVIDSYISDIKEVNADSQALCGWGGNGPFKIVNNYLEGAGENVMFGGSVPKVMNVIPSDIEVRHNHFSKPLAWKIQGPNPPAPVWSVKNIFELKNARRVLVSGNVFEYNWPHAQVGFSIVFTPRSEIQRNNDGSVKLIEVPWARVDDVTFTLNRLRHIAQGINISGHDEDQTDQTHNILIKNNVIDDMDSHTWGGWGFDDQTQQWKYFDSDSRLYQVLSGTKNIVIEHNTAFQSGPMAVSDNENDPNHGFVCRNNLNPKGTYGFFGSGHGEGNQPLMIYFPGAVFTGNALIGGNPSSYSQYLGNFFPATVEEVNFVDFAGGNYRLKATSSLKNQGSDGTDPGADLDAVESAILGVTEGSPVNDMPPPTTNPSSGGGCSFLATQTGSLNSGPFLILIAALASLVHPTLARVRAKRLRPNR